MKKNLSIGILCLILCVTFSCSQKQTEIVPNTKFEKVIKQNKSASQTLVEQIVNNQTFQEVRASERFFLTTFDEKVKSATPEFSTLIRTFDENMPLITKLNAFGISQSIFDFHITKIMVNYEALRQSIPALANMSDVEYSLTIESARNLLDLNDSYTLGYNDNAVAGCPCKRLYTSGVLLADIKFGNALNDAQGQQDRIIAAALDYCGDLVGLEADYADCIKKYGGC